MRPITVTVTDVANSSPIPLDIYLKPFQVTIQCVISGTPTYTVQYTNDDVFAEGYDPDDAGSTWFDLSGIDDAVANAVDSLISPVTAIRLVVSAVGDPADSVTMRVTQAGMIG